MSDSKPYYTLHGFTMSPFSMKMRSYMRYRRIPFIWSTGERANEKSKPIWCLSSNLLMAFLKTTQRG